MGKSAPAPPPPPDPVKTAQAQTSSNLSTAVANASIGNPNIVGPHGSTTNKVIGYQQVRGPNNEVYDLPQYEQTTTLSPEQQGLYDQQTRLGSDLNNLAIGQTSRLNDVLGRPVDAGGLPQMYGTPSTNTTDFSAGINPTATDFSAGARGMAPTNFANGLTNDFSADRTRIEQALFDRINPQLERDRAALETNLTNQGFQRGTEAFTSAMDQFGRQSNDARLAVTGQGLQEQQGMYGMSRDRAGFGASEEQRAYDQAMSSGQFGASEQARAFEQAMTAGQFGSAEQNRAFNTNMSGAQFGNQARQQSLQEMLALRNQPINEISALMSGGQVSLPSAPQYNAPQVANTDIGGYTYNSAALGQKNYEQQMAQQNAMMGGIFGLGQAGIMGAMGNPAALGKGASSLSKLWGG